MTGAEVACTERGTVHTGQRYNYDAYWIEITVIYRIILEIFNVLRIQSPWICFTELLFIQTGTEIV